MSSTTRYPYQPEQTDPAVTARRGTLMAFLSQLDTRPRRFEQPLPDEDDEEEFL